MKPIKNNHKQFFHFKNDLSFRLTWIILFTIILIAISIFSIFFTGVSFKFDPTDWIKYDTLLRTLSAVIVGFGLAIAGCGMQGVTRNVLAGPTTMGLLAAGTLGIVISQVLNLDKIYFIFIIAFIIALLVLLVNFATLKIKGYKSDDYKNVLLGLIIGAILTSVSLILKTIYPHVTENILMIIGSSNSLNYTWERFYVCAPLILIGSIIIMSLQNSLSVIDKNVTLAISLGVKVKRVYWLVGFATILISISSVILFGSIVIIGIVVPHLIRMLFKTRNYKWIMPASGLLSSISLLIATTLNLLTQWGVNIFVIIVFVPIFIFIVLKRRHN